MNPNYRIRYKKNDFELEVEGDRDFVLQQFNDLLNLESDDVGETLKSASLPTSSHHLDSVTLIEFYKSISPKTHDERFVLFAYWYILKESNKMFKVDDIVAMYTKVSEKKPSNPVQHMTNNVKRAYFERLDEGTYKITKTGIQYIRTSSITSSEKGK